MDWDKLRVFHAVAEAGSFTHAGELLNLSQSAVSRQISTLEESLNLPLFHRHARGLILTEQGEFLYKTAREIFSKLAMTEALLTESRERPQGPLKVTTSVAFGSLWLTPRIKQFLELYPDIAVTVVLFDGELDLAMREADVAIRMMPPRQPDLIQHHLLTLRYNIYANPGYLQRFGTPATAEDLDNHRIIVYGDDTRSVAPMPEINWLLAAGANPNRPRHPILEVNNVYAICRAIKSGLGIAALPNFLAPETDDLVQILPDLKGPKLDAYFVYPEELRHSKRITVFRDFLLQAITENSDIGG